MTSSFLIVLVGPPGSGKSTWARQNGHGAVHVSQDNLIDAITPGSFDHVYRPVYQAAEDAIARAALHAGNTVIVDRTNRTQTHRQRWLAIAREASCPAIAVVMSTSEDLCRRRNESREGNRRLSEERMARMFAALEPVSLDEGFSAVHFEYGVGLGVCIAEILSSKEQLIMSIATKRGDGGQTGLSGGIRVSKTHPRVECYGTIDELISQMGFARAICQDADVAGRVERIQRELYKVGSAIATPPESKKTPPEITAAMVDALEAEVHGIEAEPGILADWSLPGGAPDAAALDVARTVCRRAERLATGLVETGVIQNPNILAYLNRLSDVLWLFGRLVEARSGVNSSLRIGDKAGPRWSRAW